MTNIVNIGAIRDDACAACGSVNLHTMNTLEPIVDYLNVVVGKPYPTFNVFWTHTKTVQCQNCFQKLGCSTFEDDAITDLDLLPLDVLTKKRIDLAAADDLINLTK